MANINGWYGEECYLFVTPGTLRAAYNAAGFTHFYIEPPYKLPPAWAYHMTLREITRSVQHLYSGQFASFTVSIQECLPIYMSCAAYCRVTCICFETTYLINRTSYKHKSISTTSGGGRGGGGGGGGGGGLGGLEPPPNNDIGGPQPLLTKRQYNCYSSPARSLAYIPLSIYIMTSRKV